MGRFLGDPRHCICTNVSRGMSAAAEFLVLVVLVPDNLYRRLEKLAYLSFLTQVFHPWWCETCRVIQQQFPMKECNILGGQNILWPSCIFSGGGVNTPPPLASRIYAPGVSCVMIHKNFVNVSQWRSLLLSRVNLLCTRARCCFTNSVRPSVGCRGIVSKQMHVSLHFLTFNIDGIILDFWASSPLQNSSGNPLAGALTIHRGWENLQFSTELAVCLGNEIGPWLLWITNRKS